MSFREDGAAAVEWVAQYLERLPELPVLAQVTPGQIRAQLPAAPPDEAEPFSAVLRDLDEIVLPGVTHWQHPRFLAYFANTSGLGSHMLTLMIGGVFYVVLMSFFVSAI